MSNFSYYFYTSYISIFIPYIVSCTINAYSVELTRTQLRSIIKLNNGVLDGSISMLKERVIDGEKFGRLATCPKCGQNRLKVKHKDPGLVVCSGTIPGKSGSNNYSFCTYSERSDVVGRFGHWLGTHYFNERIEESMVFLRKLTYVQNLTGI